LKSEEPEIGVDFLRVFCRVTIRSRLLSTPHENVARQMTKYLDMTGKKRKRVVGKIIWGPRKGHV